MSLKRSWVESANSLDTDFPLNNLPYGAFVGDAGEPRCGVAIGDKILDVSGLEEDGMIAVDPQEDAVFFDGDWTSFMALGPRIWARFRAALTELLAEEHENAEDFAAYLVPQAGVAMLMPFAVSEYTDFYAGKHHAINVGTMFRGAETALPPNWLSMPIGYNGRASSVVVSGTDVVRPWGQLKRPEDELPRFTPSACFDFELELGAVVGQPSEGLVSVAEADEMIFGYVLLNDWSARDIQAWEYQPLGPFQAKATATTISPWIVPRAALEPFRVAAPDRERPLLPYLREPRPMLYNVELEVGLTPEGQGESVIARTNACELYYSAAQQLAHHASSGCPMRVGDLLGSGTISGANRAGRGSLLELSWGGQEPVTLADGETRRFLENGDTVTLRGAAKADDYRIGFGSCAGTVRPAVDLPEWAKDEGDFT